MLHQARSPYQPQAAGWTTLYPVEEPRPEYDEDTLRQALAGNHVHIPKTPCADYSKSQIKRLIDIENKLRAGKGKGYQVWAERNNIDAISQTVIFLKEHHLGSPEELEQQIDDL